MHAPLYAQSLCSQSAPSPSCLGSYGTHVLLESARLYGKIRRFLNVSTDEVYGETSLGKAEGLSEASALEPTNPYSAAKAGAEMMARAYHTSYKLPVIVTRGNNVYGPHQVRCYRSSRCLFTIWEGGRIWPACPRAPGLMGRFATGICTTPFYSPL